MKQRRDDPARLLGRLPDLRLLLRGSLVTRYRRCGRSNCHCAGRTSRGHGPSYYLMVTVGPGKTEAIYVRNEMRALVEEWIRNYRRVREILEAVSALNRRRLRDGDLPQGASR